MWWSITHPHFVFCRMLKMAPSGVLSRPSPCNVPQGYASVAELPAALLGCHFEHAGGSNLVVDGKGTFQYRIYLHGFSAAN